MDVSAAIELAWKILILAIKAGEQIPVVLKIVDSIKKWTSGEEQPTKADFDALWAMEQPYLDAIADTSQDDDILA